MAKGYKTGGRQKGVPNKESHPVKRLLALHSERYFTPRPRPDIAEGSELSDFEVDLLALDPISRVSAEIKILEYHTPKTKSQDVNIELNAGPRTIEDTLLALCTEDDVQEDDVQ